MQEDTPKSTSGLLVGPWYDGVFLLLAPLIALGLSFVLFQSLFGRLELRLFGSSQALTAVLVGALTQAHLSLVLVRSHMNGRIFRKYWPRFTLVPIALFAVMMLSQWALVTVAVLGTFWDIYHSSLQTFGLGRLYEGRAGNDPHAGRKLDLALNLFLYVGPLLASLNLFPTLATLDQFRAVDGAFFASIPAALYPHRPFFVPTIAISGLTFLAFYLYSYARLYERGHRVCFPKIVLFTTTGFVSFYSWIFLPYAVAMFVANFFHAWQYFAVVWWAEGKQLKSRFGPRALSIVLLSTFAYGLVVTLTPPALQVRWAFCLTTLLATLHYWYDGFIWSVSKGDI